MGSPGQASHCWCVVGLLLGQKAPPSAPVHRPSLDMGGPNTETGHTGIALEEDFEVQNIEWLTVEEFSEKRAEEKIHEFIKVSPWTWMAL